MAATTLNPKTSILNQVRKDWTEVTVGKIPSYMVVSLVCLFICSLVLYFHTVLVESQANEKQQSIIQSKEENYRLQATLAELKTLPGIELKARELGMEPVRDFYYIAVPAQFYNQPAASSVSNQSMLATHSIPAGY